ncbi:MAG TPA: DUF308 domain-containing protein [Ktedonobacteraceae bacterium]|nr:DUF308 domain-containing protein [Ktedonobacteraceae bacterium]
MIHAVAAQTIQRNWRMLALRGILAILFGLIVITVPGIALLAFIYVFGAYALIDGIIAVVVSLRERGSLNRWGWVLFEGILSIVAGLVAFELPGLTALALLYLVAAWAIATGVLEIVAGLAIRTFEAREWLLILAGILSVVFGILLIRFPGAGLLSLLWLVSIYAIIFGILLIIRAFQLRSWASSIEAHAV